MARKSSSKRPLLISIIGYVYMLGALLMLLTAVLAFLGMADSLLAAGELGDLEGLGTMIGGGGIVMAIILFVIAKAFLDGWTIAWYLGVIIMALGLIGGLLALPTGIVATAITAVILYYMFRPQVKSFFKV